MGGALGLSSTVSTPIVLCIATITVFIACSVTGAAIHTHGIPPQGGYHDPQTGVTTPHGHRHRRRIDVIDTTTTTIPATITNDSDNTTCNADQGYPTSTNVTAARTFPIYNTTVVQAFRSKTWLNPINVTGNPYESGNATSSWPSTAVCAVIYPNKNNRTTYYTYTYNTGQDAVAAGAFITHRRACGACSNLQDLAVYLSSPDLTAPVRKCGLKGSISQRWAINCLKDLGFSEQCADIWYYNTVNTRKNCLGVCLKYIAAPNNEKDGTLNPCLECDETKSGPIFKKYAGRTRRGSGLLSAIWRPYCTIANITHYYY